MAGNPLLSAGDNWTHRVKTFQALGIPENVYQPVLQKDIAHIVQGHQGMSDAEAYTTIAASHVGHSIIGTGTHPSLNPLANVVSDISGIIRSFNPVSLGRFAKKEVTDLADIATGKLNPFENVHNPGQAIAAAASLPIVNLIPGSYAIKNLASGTAGLHEAAAHPVGSLLDVFPYIGEAGKLAAEAGKFGALDEAGKVIPGSPAEALVQRSPIRAGYRVLPAAQRDWFHQFAMDKQISPKLVETASRPLANANRLLGLAGNKLLKDVVFPVFGDVKGITNEYDAKVAEVARGLRVHDDVPSTTLDMIREASRQLESPLVNSAAVRGDSVFHNGEVYSTQNAFGTGTNPLGTALKQLNNARDRVEALSNRLVHDGDRLLATLPDGTLAEGRLADRLNSQLDKAHEALATANDKYQNLLKTEVPIRFHPLARAKLPQIATDIVNKEGVGAGIDKTPEQVVATLADPHSIEQIQSVLSPDQFKRATADAADWSKYVNQGYDPILLPNTSARSIEQMAHPRILPEGVASPRMLDDTLWNITPGYSDLTSSLTEMGMQALKEQAGEKFILDHLVPGGIVRGKEAILNDLRDTFTRRNKPNPGRLALEQFNKNYREYSIPSHLKSQLPDALKGQDLYIDRNVLKAMETSTGQHMGSDLPFKSTFDQGNKLYKSFVLTSPRHLAHVALGGLMFQTIRDPASLTNYLHFMDYWKGMKEGKFDPRIATGLEQLSTDEIARFHVAKSLAGRFAEAAGGPVRALNKVENMIADMQRATVFDAELERQVGKGVPQSVAHEAAIKHALKVFIDLDGMTPFERSVVKQVIPFYQFTRHLFRYLFTLPVDHPIRTAILTKFAEQTQEEWGTGLPQKFQNLWFMGGPNASGNSYNIDTKTFNPFRSFGDAMSWSGFFSGLSPFITAPFTAAGFNTLNGTSDLYPDTTYDPEQGTIVAKRPSGMLAKMAQQFVPQLGALDHMVQFSDDMKGIKANSSEGYRRQLFSALGIPFVPVKTNLPQKRAATEAHKYTIAQQVVTDAIRTGDTSKLDNYTVVPFYGALVDAGKLSSFIQQLAAQAKPLKVSPRAVLSNSRNQTLAEVQR